MNRRGFFASLIASACVAAASTTRIGQTALELVPYKDDESMAAGARYAEHLARSMLETKETLAANILNRAFEPYDKRRWLSGAWADGATEWETV